MTTAREGDDAEIWSAIQARALNLQHSLFESYERHVSFGDLVIDRWQRASIYGFGEGSSCYDNVLVLGSVKVGRHVWIGPNVILDGSGGLEIGDYCAISAGAQIYSHNSVGWSTSLGQSPIERAPTRLGQGVYVGPGAIVEMGVSIGDCAVIGALTLVNKSIPSGARMFGVPGRLQE
jgi:acetyltransferase-like isoleucine patch superfamily enzyme